MPGKRQTAAPKQQTRKQFFESYGWRDAADVAQRLKASPDRNDYEARIDRDPMRSDEEHCVQEFNGAPQFLIIAYRLIDWLDRKSSGRSSGSSAEHKNFDPGIAYQVTKFRPGTARRWEN